jgi:hypothetical protein
MGNNQSTKDTGSSEDDQKSISGKAATPPKQRYIYDYVPDFPCPLDPYLTKSHETAENTTSHESEHSNPIKSDGCSTIPKSAIITSTSRLRIIRETAAEPIQPQKLPHECFKTPSYSSLTWCISIALNYCLQNIRPRILITESQIWNYCYTRKYGGGTLPSATHFLTFRDCLQILTKTPGIFNITRPTGETTVINFEYYRIAPSQILEQLRDYRLILIGLPIFSNFWKTLQGRQKIKIVVSPSKYDRYLGGMWGIIMGYTAITESYKVLIPVRVDGGSRSPSGNSSGTSASDVNIDQEYAIIDISEEFIASVVRDMWLLDIWLDSYNMDTIGEIAQLKEGEKGVR